MNSMFQVSIDKRNHSVSCNSSVPTISGFCFRRGHNGLKDKPTDLIDEFIILGNSRILFEVLRCIHVGLLCVQQKQEDRPNMSFMVLMLSSDNSLPNPR